MHLKPLYSNSFKCELICLPFSDFGFFLEKTHPIPQGDSFIISCTNQLKTETLYVIVSKISIFSLIQNKPSILWSGLYSYVDVGVAGAGDASPMSGSKSRLSMF